MRALVVYESMFGNTHRIADAIADGMADGSDVSVFDVSDAPQRVPDDVDLLVVGGPTHAFSMSRLATRRGAARRGGAYTDVPEGLREWLHALPAPPSACAFAAFDTRVDMPLLPGAASQSAARVARKLGLEVVDTASFLVEGYEGPLVGGQLQRAREWGHGLTEQLAG
ncbi:flavodoxin family protein [Microbacterium sp. LWH3-1.2]|uniref:flavodoxin family protein n=1 Tax=Microbacterium sp. LWH3-1.2 TaxID=3135256 RepID=UPI00343B3E02